MRSDENRPIYVSKDFIEEMIYVAMSYRDECDKWLKQRLELGYNPLGCEIKDKQADRRKAQECMERLKAYLGVFPEK